MKKIDGAGTTQKSLPSPSRPLENQDQLAEEIWLRVSSGFTAAEAGNTSFKYPRYSSSRTQFSNSIQHLT